MKRAIPEAGVPMELYPPLDNGQLDTNPPLGVPLARFKATKEDIKAHCAAKGVVADDRAIDEYARGMYAMAKAVAVAILHPRKASQ